MKEEDNISQLFKCNEHKLDEMPSTLAWDRLEQRLDERDSHQKSFTFKRMAVAAAVFISLSMLALWTYINPLNNAMSENTAMFDKKRLPSEIVASDAPSPARPILMSHRERSKYLTELDNVRVNTKPVLANKLKPTNNAPKINAKKVRPVPSPPVASTVQPIASADLNEARENLPTTSTTFNEVRKTENNPSITSSTTPVISDDLRDTKQALATKASPPNKNKLNEEQAGITTGTVEAKVVIAEEFVLADVEKQEEDAVVRVQSDKATPAAIVMDEVQTTITTTSAKPSKNRRNKRKSRASGKSVAKDMATQSESVSSPTPLSDMEIESAEQGIDKFDWLLGKWADEADNSFEEWYRTDADTIEGKGYFVVDVDTTFTHSMKLVELNQQVYFMVNGQLVEGNFQLESYDDSRAIFKNDANNNAQITLKQDATNTFSITVENQSTEKEAKETKKKRRILKRVRKKE